MVVLRHSGSGFNRLYLYVQYGLVLLFWKTFYYECVGRIGNFDRNNDRGMEITPVLWFFGIACLCLPAIAWPVLIIIQQRKELKELRSENEELKIELRGIVKNTIENS